MPLWSSSAAPAVSSRANHSAQDFPVRRATASLLTPTACSMGRSLAGVSRTTFAGAAFTAAAEAVLPGLAFAARATTGAGLADFDAIALAGDVLAVAALGALTFGAIALGAAAFGPVALGAAAFGAVALTG